jgi:hypothetical protein
VGTGIETIGGSFRQVPGGISLSIRTYFSRSRFFASALAADSESEGFIFRRPCSTSRIEFRQLPQFKSFCRCLQRLGYLPSWEGSANRDNHKCPPTSSSNQFSIRLTHIPGDTGNSTPTAIKAILDAYNPQGSTAHVNFTTSKATRWKTDPRKCHVNWVICDSDWEAEFCRVAEAHPRVRAYVKNQGLGFEVPYLMGSTPHKYLPDFIVQVDDGQEQPLNLVVEIKGYRGEDAKEKANTMRSYWVPGVNNLGKFGRWAFAEFRSVFDIDSDFDKLIKSFAGKRNQ